MSRHQLFTARSSKQKLSSWRERMVETLNQSARGPDSFIPREQDVCMGLRGITRDRKQEQCVMHRIARYCIAQTSLGQVLELMNS